MKLSKMIIIMLILQSWYMKEFRFHIMQKLGSMFIQAERWRMHSHGLVLGWLGEADLGAHDDGLRYCWCWCWGNWCDRKHGLVLGLAVLCCCPPWHLWHLHAHASEPLSLSSFAANVLDDSLHYEGEYDSQDESQDEAGALQLGFPVHIEKPCIGGGLCLLDDITEDGALACPLDIQGAHERHRRVLLAPSCHVCLVAHVFD